MKSRLSLWLAAQLFLLFSPMAVAGDFWSSAGVRIGRALPASLCPAFWLYETANKERDREHTAGYRGDLFGRDLNLALLGDSLSTGFHYEGTLGSAWVNRISRQRNWFLDSDPSPNSVDSVYERLARLTEVQATTYARAGAIIEHVNFTDPAYRRIIGDIDDLGEQVDGILAGRELPNLILSWIGHNNMSWVNDLEEHPELGIDARLQQIPLAVHRQYEIQIDRLIERSRTVSYPVAIVIYGLYDWHSFTVARDEVAEYRKSHPQAYPYFYFADQSVHCLRPEYREETTRLKLATEKELQNMVEELNSRLSQDPQLAGRVRLFYSDAFARTFLQREDLNSIDAWHPSPRLHQRFATAVTQDLTERGGPLDFLGIHE